MSGDRQNITPSLPRGLLGKAKRLVVERATSLSALMNEALARLAGRNRRYAAVRPRALANMRAARSLRTRGRVTWTREALHER